jgi:hypothetical protein
MAGVNAQAVKAALLAQIAALPELAGVQVAYSYPGRTVERECVYGGRIEGATALAAMRAGARLKREEDSVLSLHISVDTPGEASTEAAEARTVALGAPIENHIAANPTLGDVPGLLLARVAGHELDSGVDDESAEAVLTYQIALKSYLT